MKPTEADFPSTARRCVLYYPTVAIPSGAWLRQALLYWDEIGSIVPNRHQDWRASNHVDIQYLMDVGAYQPRYPDALFHSPGGWEQREELEREFWMIIHSPKVWQRVLKTRDGEPWVSIYVEKVAGSLLDALVDGRLATSNLAGDGTYLFHPVVAAVYMGLLAKHLALIDPHLTIPATDRLGAEALIYRHLRERGNSDGFEVRLPNCLPSPTADVSLEDILKFKTRRRNELLHFRESLDGFARDLAEASEPQEVKCVMVAFAERMERSLADLDTLMGEGRITRFAGSMKTLVEAKTPGLWSKFIVGMGVTQLAAVPLSWMISGAAVAGGLEVARSWFQARDSRHATLRGSPFAYLYHARASGVVGFSKAGQYRLG